MNRTRTVCLAVRAALACVAAAWACDGLAQASATVSFDSDYRFRGVSLSGNRPGLRAAVDYDAAGGWYAGASATRAQAEGGDRYLLVTAFAGRVLPLTPLLDLDVGASGWAFSDGGMDFVEAYAGLAGRAWTLRLNASPDYFGQHLRTWYLDANAHSQLTDSVRVFVHAGELLASASRGPAPQGYVARPGAGVPAGRTRWDVRAGAGWNPWRTLDLQLAWTTSSRDGPAPAPSHRSGWVAGASISF